MPKRTKPATPAKIASPPLQAPAPNPEWLDIQLDALGASRKTVSETFDPGNPNWLTKCVTLKAGAPIRRIQIAEALWLAGVLRVDFIKLLELGFRFDVPRPKLQVVGRVDLDCRVVPFAPADAYLDLAPPDVSASAVGLEVERGDGRRLRAFEGCIVYYDPINVIAAHAEGQVCVCRLGNEPREIVGTVQRAASIKRRRIVSLDGAREVETEHLVSASPVLWARTP
jgi:hypothetical protein